MGGDDADVREDRGQRPMEVDAFDYYETGRLNVAPGPDLMPVIEGGRPSPPEPGLSEDRLICNAAEGRPACDYYVALLVPADGAARGFDEMRQIRRFCTKLATASELYELTGNVYACTARRPQDDGSGAKIADFEARQRANAQEAAETSGSLDF